MSLRARNKGITVVEAVVAVSIFAVLVTVAYQAYLVSNRLIQSADRKDRAVWLAEEGIEVLRNMRDVDFANVTVGTKGLVQATSTWAFSGTSDITNGYIRTVTISSVDADTKNVVSKVDWLDRGATSTVSLTSNLTNWSKTITAANSLSVDTANVNLSLLSLGRLLTGITVSSDGSAGTTTISKVRLTWTTSANRLQSIYMPTGTQVFGPGSVASGATTTLTTAVNFVGASTKSVDFYFSASMGGNTIGITFIMSDGSTKAVTVINPPTGL